MIIAEILKFENKYPCVYFYKESQSEIIEKVKNSYKLEEELAKFELETKKDNLAGIKPEVINYLKASEIPLGFGSSIMNGNYGIINLAPGPENYEKIKEALKNIPEE